MLGCFNPNLGQIWTNPNAGLKMQLKNLQLKFEITILTQHLGLSIFDPNLVSNNPALFRVQECSCLDSSKWLTSAILTHLSS